MMAAPRRNTDMTISLLLQGFVADDQIGERARHLEVHAIQLNSKAVSAGDVFIAQAGHHQHGIDYAADAIERGAKAVLVESNDTRSEQRVALLSRQYPEVEFITVKDLTRKTGAIASRYYGDPGNRFKLIGVTGTDGKTSVTHLLVQAFKRLGIQAGSVGTLGYGVDNELKMTGLTTPDAVSLQGYLFELAVSQCEYVVMEVSSHALDQYRVSGCDFNIAVLTNLGSDHLDYHQTELQYQQAKARLFEDFKLESRVLNLDDAFGQELAIKYNGEKLTGYSTRVDTADTGIKPAVQLLHSRMAADGLEIEVKTALGNIQISTALIGDFNIENLLACVSTLLDCGFERADIEQAMQGLLPIPGRMEFFPSLSGHAAVVIDFAHTEQALAACLRALQGAVKGRLYCVFGCGGDRDKGKRASMAAVAEQLSDQVIVTDDNPRNESPQQIMMDILSGFQKPDRVRVIHDRKLAIETALREATENDLVVIAGKGHEQEQIIGDQRIPFSDHQIVRQLLQESRDD